MGQNIKPFPFDQLPHYTQVEIEHVNQALNYLPRQGFNLHLVERLEAFLGTLLGDGVELKYAQLENCRGEDFSKNRATPFVAASVTLTPLVKAGIIDIDPEIAYVLIHRLIGTGQSVMRPRKNLTALEAGVIEFLLIKVLVEVMRLTAQGGKLRLRFNRFVTGGEELAALIAGQDIMSLLSFKLRLDQHFGFVRVLLPHPLLTEVGRPQHGLIQARPDVEDDFFKSRLNLLAHTKTVLWGEVGRFQLTAGQWRQIERGDIVLFDDPLVGWESEHLSGPVTLRIGRGEKGGMLATVAQDRPDRLLLALDSVFHEA